MHADLPAVRDAFLTRFLAELPGAPALSALGSAAAAPVVMLGEYAEHAGTAITPLPGATITPRFVVRARDGSATRSYPLLWVVERLDVATDSVETMARILADYRDAADGSGAGLASPLARRWAEALAEPATRAALARPLAEITAVPAGVPAEDVEELHAFLQHFGTWREDGACYAKGAVAEGSFPAGVNPAYLAPDTGNLAELQLQRDAFYAYALVPERAWAPQAARTRCRQLVYRLDDRGPEAGAQRWRLALLHSVAGTQAAGAAARFVVFHAPVGLGLAVPAGARRALSASTAALLDALPDHLAHLATALADPLTPIVGKEDAPVVLLIGSVAAGFPSTPLPAGVVAGGEGTVRTFRCPPDQVMALAARDDVDHLVLSSPVWPTMQHARAEMNLAGWTMPTGMTLADAGRGVLVGLVDSGIDGGHPAFLGRQDDPSKSRIHSVWQMWQGGGTSPAARAAAPVRANYADMSFGHELIGHDEVITATDEGEHGTHVAGIAAGRPFGTAWPGGIAPAATLVVVGVGSRGFVNDVALGVRYCFNKAQELGLPCVVNISLGTERHSHDGTDPLSGAITRLVSVDQTPAGGPGGVLPSAMPVYREGRIVCAAAGNLRGDPLHWQATIPAGGEVQVLYQPFGRGATSRNDQDGITFWAYNEDGTAVRLRISTRHSRNRVMATAAVPLQDTNRPVTTRLPGGCRVNVHNGPEAPNNRHYNPEIYWIRRAPAAATATAPWIVRLFNEGRSPCVVHGFAAYREHAGGFVFDAAPNQRLIATTYSEAQLRQFESHKIHTPGTAPGVICVGAYTSRPGMADPADEIAPFSSPGPLRAAQPGQRAIDCAMPGHVISSAKAATTADPSRGVQDMSGTSMATPMMTGLVAAALQQKPTLTTAQVLMRIEAAASRRPVDGVEDWGLGRIDAGLFQA